MNKKWVNYEHTEIEQTQLSDWSKLADGTIENKNHDFFSIVLPPPNVTGTLHLGHAWDGTLQDILIRYYKLAKQNVFWVSGMDHAGIATQTKFEKELAKTQKKRTDFSREVFNQMINDWKNKHAQTIREQWKKMGFCLPTKNERFTLDAKSQAIVLDAFLTLYDKNLVYQAKKLVNWDSKLQTAISNMEVVHEEVTGKIYYVDYVYANNPNQKITIATTRPETMFADVCLVINPKDPRCAELLSQKVINPANKEIIPIISDSYIDMDFGSGVMKCTPGHDFNDWDIGLRHNLEVRQCIGLDGKMLKSAQEFSGLDKLVCREKLVAKFKAENLVVEKDYTSQIGFSERSHVIVEPMLSKQWFVKTSAIAKIIKAKMENNAGQILFWPDNYSQAIYRYLDKMEDWCISRQLSWGIQIPAFYHKKTKAVHCGLQAPDDSGDWVQDLDVFDTWFSSGLWPLTVLETYKNSVSEYSSFFPSTVLVTGVDILFFWVSRMMIFGAIFHDQVPFKNVYLHGLIRDEQNRKMSKSLNNGIDPQDLIKKYGADTLRLFFASYTSSGEDLIYKESKIKTASVFINKLWSAYNFLELKNFNLVDKNFDDLNLLWSEKWLYQKLQELQADLKKMYKQFRFNLIVKKITDFIWDDFCGWYLELIKIKYYNQEIAINSQKFTAWVWNEILKLLNPIIPFVTEYIYVQIHHSYDFYNQLENEKKVSFTLKNTWFFDYVKIVRNIRNELKIQTGQQFLFQIVVPKHKMELLSESIHEITDFFNLVNTNFQALTSRPSSASKIAFSINDLVFEIFTSTELASTYKKILDNKIEKLLFEVNRSKTILSNPNFQAKASAEKINLERDKLSKYETELNNYYGILKLQ